LKLISSAHSFVPTRDNDRPLQPEKLDDFRPP
jgi:hypothetical protein